ncbi:DegT/DnrJ/EryC1/StrS family aminotransferase [Natranaeroarchaeum sulfidigenes]|uniref:Putative pyridoxal phosphate-dependent enzyme apparently involved in regulation of cell wall biogenesis n=1 Tax=Natranaeroarchaeum sulfidigenes TaxID=2784880 RepID=A0A897MR50_9EURY|nr:DegT/DnrJ/EryC1/StrS family aminotransferase [Natranaeroarchaeum sulfidigenes]QSG03007.1 putative pyridoxal phosphate-dependent enzyme apparently involved in regulation of cell wall biogenesis [Natranaeroarchaeum sulfidigenes]
MANISIADPDLGRVEAERVADVIDSGMVADGPTVRQFESAFADYCDVEHAVATSNGTTALHAAFEALEIGQGDRVVTTPFSFVASANAIRLAGAEPVFADIDPETYNLDPDAVTELLDAEGETIDAILAVHLYGLPANIEPLAALADEHDLLLVEDAAQAHGATYNGERVGSFGDAACFSFYPTKNMTTGEGGMITTDREDVAERAAQFVNHGRSDTYEHVELGHNFRMTSIGAAIGLAQLEKLPEYVAKRRENARILTERLRSQPAVATPFEPAYARHAYHQYTIRCKNRDRLRSYLDNAGIGTGVYYPTPIHEQPAYDHVETDAPVAEQAAREVLSLPVHPALSIDDVRSITTVVQSCYE